MIDISVIIVNYRGWEDLEKCLCSIEKIENDHFSFEVIVVDNCSNDGRLDDFKLRFPGFRFVLNSGNNGFSNGCNFGAASSCGTYLLFLNPDIIANSAAFSGLLLTFKRNPEIMVLSCEQLNNDKRKEQKLRLFPSFLTLNGIGRSIFRRVKQKQMAAQSAPQNEIVYPDWVSGSVVFISKTNFDKLNGWDDSFWLYYEDVDLCYRAKAIGGKVALTNQVSMIHNHGGTTRINIKTATLTKSEVIISLHVFLSKHNSKIKVAFLHLMVIFEVLVIKLVPAILGLILFFVKRLQVYSRLYLLMVKYYLSVIAHGSWLSFRSVRFKS